MNNRFLLHKDKTQATRIFTAICKIDFIFKQYTFDSEIELTKIGMNSELDFYQVRFNAIASICDLERFAQLRDALTYYPYE